MKESKFNDFLENELPQAEIKPSEKELLDLEYSKNKEWNIRKDRLDSIKKN